MKLILKKCGDLMNFPIEHYLLLKSKTETKEYTVKDIVFHQFEPLLLHSVSIGSSLSLMDFDMIEKETGFIHSFKLAFHMQMNSVGFYFSFHNPFNREQSITHINLNQNDIPLHEFLIPFIQNQYDILKEHDFPIDDLLDALNIEK